MLLLAINTCAWFTLLTSLLYRIRGSFLYLLHSYICHHLTSRTFYVHVYTYYLNVLNHGFWSCMNDSCYVDLYVNNNRLWQLRSHCVQTKFFIVAIVGGVRHVFCFRHVLLILFPTAFCQSARGCNMIFLTKVAHRVYGMADSYALIRATASVAGFVLAWAPLMRRWWKFLHCCFSHCESFCIFS